MKRNSISGLTTVEVDLAIKENPNEPSNLKNIGWKSLFN